MKGWRFESTRHALAAKGIRTGYMKPKSITQRVRAMSAAQLRSRAAGSKIDLEKGAKLTEKAARAREVPQEDIEEIRLQQFRSTTGQKRVLEMKQDSGVNSSLGLPQQTFERVGKGGASARGSSARALAKINFEKVDKAKARRVLANRLDREVAIGPQGSEEKKKFLRTAIQAIDLKTPEAQKKFVGIAKKAGEKKPAKKVAKKQEKEQEEKVVIKEEVKVQPAKPTKVLDLDTGDVVDFIEKEKKTTQGLKV
jgi:hypothetical protein